MIGFRLICGNFYLAVRFMYVMNIVGPKHFIYWISVCQPNSSLAKGKVYPQ
jgi:hypothetical protein